MSSARPLRLSRRVQLAPLTEAHAPAMYRWMCDPAVSQNLGLRSEPSPARTSAWIERAAADATVEPFAVLLEQQHVGNVVLDRIDEYLGAARLSIYIGEAAARGAGVGRTGLYLALAHGFGPLALHKIWLTVHTRNTPALSLYTRIGFQVEGVLRDEFRLADERIAALYMGLLRDEFGRLAAEWER